MLRRIQPLLLALLLAACSGGTDMGDLDANTATRQGLTYDDCNYYGYCSPSYCGDGYCSLGEEDSWSCPTDCGGSGYCGDGYCSDTEDSWSCSNDCGSPTACGDGICNMGETSESCPGDCGSGVGTVLGRFSRYCGKVNSQQSPGSGWTPDSDCTSGCNIGGLAYCQKFWPASVVIREVAVSSKPNNAWANAGCAPVTDDWDGNDEFECVAAGPVCGNGTCESAHGETPSSCSADCGTCGNGVCDVASGEDYFWCGRDCGIASTCGDGFCNNGETGATCSSDCVSPTYVVSPDFPNGILRFEYEADFDALLHTLEENPSAASSLPSGFTSLKAHLAAFPINESTYEVSREEYLRDMQLHLADDEALQSLLNPDMQTLAGGKLYQLTDIGLFKVDSDKIAWFKSWYASTQDSINFDPNYKTVPGEVALGSNEYQIAPGVVRIDTGEEKLAGSDTTPDEVVLGRFSRWCGKVNTLRSSSGTWRWDSDCTSGCNVGGLAYCQKFWPNATSVRQVPVSSKPNNVWANAGCAAIINDFDGQDEFECVGPSSAPIAMMADAREDSARSSEGFGTTSCGNPNAITYDLHTVGSGFNKKGTKEFSNRRFVFKTKKLDAWLFRTIYIKGKLQRRKKALFVKYWGPSNADEIIIGTDNLDLWTDYVFPTPHNFTGITRPQFKGIIDSFKLGNHVFPIANVDINVRFLSWSLNQNDIQSYVNSQINSVANGVWNNVWSGIERNIINSSLDATYLSRYEAYTKKINALKEANTLRWTFGKTEKARGYGHKNAWTFDHNGGIKIVRKGSGGVSSVGPNDFKYKYDMRAGSFFGRARVGCDWYGIRIVRQ
jgi:hypothetical protein